MALRVADLAGTSAFYTEALGLVPLVPLVPVGPAGGDGVVVLGSAGEPLVVLVDAPGAAPRGAGEPGLAHAALLADSTSELARLADRARRHPGGRFAGGADHLVSRSFYLADPEGNGVELYADRPSSQWCWEDGRVVMGNEPLDLDDLLAERPTPADQRAAAGPDPAAVHLRPGHVHLEVGDVDEAAAFYAGALGLAVTAELPGAVFLAWGGYHHRVAANCWSTRGARRRGPALGLERLSMVVPGPADLADLEGRLDRAGVPSRADGARLEVEDPWGTTVEVSVAGGS